MTGSPGKGERCGTEMNLAPIAAQKLEWVMKLLQLRRWTLFPPC
jgi:hypothetical protein